jgi:hypothetical protein
VLDFEVRLDFDFVEWLFVLLLDLLRAEVWVDERLLVAPSTGAMPRLRTTAHTTSRAIDLIIVSSF